MTQLEHVGADILECISISPKFVGELADQQQLLEFSDLQIQALIRLAAGRGVAVLRDQHMTAQQQAQFAQRLGKLLLSRAKTGALPEKLTLIHVAERTKRVAATGWHSDVSSAATPVWVSTLMMEVVPECGGDTLCADVARMFAGLSPTLQGFLQPLHARHEARTRYRYISGAKRLNELPPTDQPVVRWHSYNQRSGVVCKRSLHQSNCRVGSGREQCAAEHAVRHGRLFGERPMSCGLATEYRSVLGYPGRATLRGLRLLAGDSAWLSHYHGRRNTGVNSGLWG